MIKLFIKHKIFDWCISTIFKTIGSNFYDVNLVTVGNQFSQINIKRNHPNGSIENNNYVGCTITNVYNGRYFGQKITLFNFSTKSGDLILACDKESIEFIK